MAEGFPGVGVAEVHLHEGQGHRQHGITDRHRGVGVGGGVDQDPVAGRAPGLAARLLDAVHQAPLVVALEAGELHPQRRGLLFQGGIDGRQGAAAIEARLPLAEQVEVGAMEHEQAHGWEGRLVSSEGVVRVGARVVNGGGL